jgi:three-Cys-motif partner protein
MWQCKNFSMEDKGFFNKQTALTASKTLIYEQYIKVYLPKLVSTFGKIFIADLFCGPGMNGEKKGSPLILIDSINYIFSSEIFKKISDKKVSILFNDQDPKFIESLNFEIKRLEYNKNEISIRVENQKYEFILPSLLSSLHGDKTPKFFFLDPFTYSNVKMSDLKELMNLPNT